MGFLYLCYGIILFLIVEKIYRNYPRFKQDDDFSILLNSYSYYYTNIYNSFSIFLIIFFLINFRIDVQIFNVKFNVSFIAELFVLNIPCWCSFLVSKFHSRLSSFFVILCFLLRSINFPRKIMSGKMTGQWKNIPVPFLQEYSFAIIFFFINLFRFSTIRFIQYSAMTDNINTLQINFHQTKSFWKYCSINGTFQLGP